MDAARDACGARRTARRRLGRLVLVGVAFLATTVLLRNLQSPPLTPTLRPKLDSFLADKDAYDAVFIGSSRVQRGVQPQVIDERLSSPGRRFRSFNLGVPGMDGFEADRVLREVLASDPERLRLVVLEVPQWRVPGLAPSRHTERYVEWHDLPATCAVLGSIWRQPFPLAAKLTRTWEHLRAFLLRASNYATAARFGAVRAPAVERLVAGLAAVRGYLPLHEDLGGRLADRRRRFLAAPAEYRGKVARLRRLAGRGTLASAEVDRRYDRRALARQVERVRASGARAVYLAPPLLTPAADYARMAREGLIPHLIDLRDPREFAELFDPRNRFDREHMNQDGARLMSAIIAEQLAPMIDDRGPEASSREEDGIDLRRSRVAPGPPSPGTRWGPR